MSDNPYTSPPQEPDQPERDLVLAKPSWPVHRVSVVNLILGTLGLVCTGLNVFWTIIEHLTFKVPGADFFIHDTYVVQEYPTSMAVWWIFVIFFCSPAIFYLPAGYGVYHRSKWGRCYALILAAITGLFGTGMLLRGLDLVWRTHTEEFPTAILGGAMLGYAVWVYVIMTNLKYSAEFECPYE